MIKSRQIIEVLESRKYAGISQVEAGGDGCVRAQLENRNDQGKPYTLTVRLDSGVESLRLCIPLLSIEQPASVVPLVRASAGIDLAKGCLRIDSEHGLAVEFNLDWPGRGDSGSPAQVFGQWLDGVIEEFRDIEMLMLRAQQLLELCEAAISGVSGASFCQR